MLFFLTETQGSCSLGTLETEKGGRLDRVHFLQLHGLPTDFGASSSHSVPSSLLLHTWESWPTAPARCTPASSPGTERPFPSPASPCRCRRSTRSTTAGTWPASSSSCSSSSPCCPSQLWRCFTSCWTAAAVPKARRIGSYRRRGRAAAASSWPAFARNLSPTPRWYRDGRGGDDGRGWGFTRRTRQIRQQPNPTANNIKQHKDPLKLLHAGNSQQKVVEHIPQHQIWADLDLNVASSAYTPTCCVGWILKAMFTWKKRHSEKERVLKVLPESLK